MVACSLVDRTHCCSRSGRLGRPRAVHARRRAGRRRHGRTTRTARTAVVTRSWPDQPGKSCPPFGRSPQRPRTPRVESLEPKPPYPPTTRAAMAGVPAPRHNGTRARDPARGPPARRTGSAFDMGAIGGVVRTVLSVDDFALFRPAARGCRRLGAERTCGHLVTAVVQARPRSSGARRSRSPLVSSAGSGPHGRWAATNRGLAAGSRGETVTRGRTGVSPGDANRSTGLDWAVGVGFLLRCPPTLRV
jgi:hypothetical protein